ncbi:uncharacterized protein BJ212DRAFT_319075 [Suillus subaureus]|uniref:Uncharacterized protein n=1 Tax=Suillus subaureus TaxID=48587 RepID=A0A9P7EMD5_9AGAM|nr:uncharacterized protein BJ212DRAFT_319075 [Suillus subaureus]KAG1826019.1 hypothetical protein BJ212DRAFT_319075 [Suillus subaureus]
MTRCKSYSTTSEISLVIILVRLGYVSALQVRRTVVHSRYFCSRSWNRGIRSIKCDISFPHRCRCPSIVITTRTLPRKNDGKTPNHAN